jgi:hypothetical protein
MAAGCCCGGGARYAASPPAPLGYASDPIWRMHEANGEASDFVMYDHEFAGRTARLNQAGEDHVRQIAARAAAVPFPVLVERSDSKPAGKYNMPSYPDPELDMRRRAVVVAALQAMGVPDAEQRVVVAPALAEGHEDVEAERAYAIGLRHDESLFGRGSFFGWFGRGGGGF